MVLESRGQPCRCRVSSKLEGAVFKFTFHTSSECVRVFLDAGASSECSTVWGEVPKCMVCMCVLGMSNLFHVNSTLTTLVDLHALVLHG